MIDNVRNRGLPSLPSRNPYPDNAGDPPSWSDYQSFFLDCVLHRFAHNHGVTASDRGERHGDPRLNFLPLHRSYEDPLRFQDDIPRARVRGCAGVDEFGVPRPRLSDIRRVQTETGRFFALVDDAKGYLLGSSRRYIDIDNRGSEDDGTHLRTEKEKKEEENPSSAGSLF